MRSEMRLGMEEAPPSILEHNAQVIDDLKHQLAEARAEASKLQQHHEDVMSALKADLSRLQIENSDLTDDTMTLLEAKQGLEDMLLEHESREYGYQQAVADLQEALAAATRLPPVYPSAIPSKPWTVPAMHKKIEQLTQQLAELQEQYEEVQPSSGHTGDMQGVLDDLAEREFEVSALSSTVERLTLENLRLELHSEGVSDVNRQLKEQVADLQSQLRQLKDTNVQQEQTFEHQLTECNQVVANLQAALAAVPAMDRKIQQLTQELADVQGKNDELQKSCVQYPDMQGVHNDLVERERKMSALTRTATFLQEENLWLRNESQCVFECNQQLQAQAVDLQGQLQQLQDTVADLQAQQQQQQQKGEDDEVVDKVDTITELEEHQQLRETDEILSAAPQEQLEPPCMVRASSDPAEAPGTPNLVAGSFTEADSRALQPNPDNRSSSMRCSTDSHATTARPQSRTLPQGNRGLRAGQAVMSAAAAGVLIMLRLRTARR